MTTAYRLITIGFAVLLTTLSAAAATPVHKCTINGTVTFQRDPCSSAEVRKQPTLEQLNAERPKRPRQSAAESSAPLGPGAEGTTDSRTSERRAPPAATTDTKTRFTCDGRTHCSQMSSCSEAKYFLANCPGAKMDGNHDGVPCEQQWCN